MSATDDGTPSEARDADLRRDPPHTGDEHLRMHHLDPDQLTALALDPETADAYDDAHLADCARCRSELETLRAATARARRAGRAEPLPVPPEHIWDSVVHELSTSGDLGPRRAPAVRWQPWALAAALVLIAVLAAATLLPLTGGSVIATARLEPLATVSQARADLVDDGGQRTLSIAELELPQTDGYYELWLLTPAGDGLISLGPVGDNPTVQVPAAIDVERFSVVDISREPQDGDPSHSTDSVLRGALEPVT